jgi:RNA polymerase sigma factor (sigma-70 family)
MRSATPSDAVLIGRSLAHPGEFEALFERHAAVVLQYLRLRVGYSMAEELMAETFVRAFDARQRFDSRRTSALPWLYGIASNLIRMHFRTEERRLRAYRAAAGLEIPAGDLTEERVERLYASELAPAIAAALAALPAAQSDALLLHTYAELTHEEIAEALGLVIPLDGVRRLAQQFVDLCHWSLSAPNVVAFGKVSSPSLPFRPRRSAMNLRARCRRLRTEPVEMPSASAISSWVSSA